MVATSLNCTKDIQYEHGFYLVAFVGIHQSFKSASTLIAWSVLSNEMANNSQNSSLSSNSNSSSNPKRNKMKSSSLHNSKRSSRTSSGWLKRKHSKRKVCSSNTKFGIAACYLHVRLRFSYTIIAVLPIYMV